MPRTAGKESISQFWVFTANNYQKTDIETRLEDLLDDHKKPSPVSYLVYGYETGKEKEYEGCAICGSEADNDSCIYCGHEDVPGNKLIWHKKPGTPHLQGYVEFKVRKRFSTVAELLPGCRIDTRKGTAEQAANYCKKGSQPHEEWDKEGAKGALFGKDAKVKEFGTIGKSEQGRRNDLETIRTMALDEGVAAVAEAGYGLQAIKYAEKIVSLYTKPRKDKPFVAWIHGGSGLGKSRISQQIPILFGYREKDIYTKSESGKWMDGYENHNVCIMDEFRNSWMSYNDFLSLIDRYGRRVEVKGGSREFVAKLIIINCMQSPEETFKDCGEDLRQIMRRIDLILKVEGETVLEMPNWAHDTMPKINFEAQKSETERIIKKFSRQDNSLPGGQGQRVDRVLPSQRTLKGPCIGALPVPLPPRVALAPSGTCSPDLKGSDPACLMNSTELINFSEEKCAGSRGGNNGPPDMRKKLNNLKASRKQNKETIEEFLETIK